jgi:LysM repeat protein
MPTPREQGGGLVEASRLLQEGLQLLDERSREVDVLVRRAEERARRITSQAEARAHEITAESEARAYALTEQSEARAHDLTAEAERQRADLEDQVAALRGEVGALRDELTALRAAQAQPATGRIPQRRSGPPMAVPLAATGSGGDVGVAGDEPAVVTTLEAGEVADSGQASEPQAKPEATSTPRWGRPSTIDSAQQTIRSRKARPGWLPPWLPFLIVLAAAGALATRTVDSQANSRARNDDARPSNVIFVTFVPTRAITPTPPAPPSGLNVATATSIVTSLAMAVNGRPQADPTAAATSTSTSMSTTRFSTTAAAALPAAIVLPPARPSLTAPLSLAADVSPDGPIVAAYTTYSTYTVKAGDALNQVAAEFGANGDAIVRASGLSDANLLLPGQVLTIPRDTGWLYRVQPGDQLSQVALRFAVTVDDIQSANGGASSVLRSGDLLFIPNRALPGSKQ